MAKFQVLNFNPEQGDRMVVHVPANYSEQEIEEVHKVVDHLLKADDSLLVTISDEIIFTIIRIGDVPLQNEDYLVTLHHEEA